MFTDLAAIRVYHVGNNATRAHATRRESSTGKRSFSQTRRDSSDNAMKVPKHHAACMFQPGESPAIAPQVRQVRHPVVADGGFVACRWIHTLWRTDSRDDTLLVEETPTMTMVHLSSLQIKLTHEAIHVCCPTSQCVWQQGAHRQSCLCFITQEQQPC